MANISKPCECGFVKWIFWRLESQCLKNQYPSMAYFKTVAEKLGIRQSHICGSHVYAWIDDPSLDLWGSGLTCWVSRLLGGRLPWGSRRRLPSWLGKWAIRLGIWGMPTSRHWFFHKLTWEYGHRNSPFTMICLLKLMFHSFVNVYQKVVDISLNIPLNIDA